MKRIYERFRNRVVLVIGHGDALGTAVAETLRAEGGIVCTLDLKDAGALREQVRRFYQTHGRLDVIVLVPIKENRDERPGDAEPIDWHRSVSGQWERIFEGIEESVSLMKSTGGVLLAVCSALAADTGIDQDLGASVLHSSVRQYMRCAATRLAGYRIRSGVVLYGGLDDVPEEAAKTPLGRMSVQPKYLSRRGTVADVAQAVAFLASDDGTFMTGAELHVDGGIGVGTDRYSTRLALGQVLLEQRRQAGMERFDGDVTHKGQTQKPDDDRPAAFSPDRIGSKETGPPKTIVLTGVSKGLGRILVERLIAQGHTVAGCARSVEAIEQLNRRYGTSHRFDTVDLLDRQSVVRWAASLAERGIVPDFLINNAAVTGNTSLQTWKQTDEHFREVVSTNIMATVNTIHAFVPAMIRKMNGIIVNFSSGWGRTASPKVSPYATSKWGIEGLSRVLATELPNKMACVSLHPGTIHTETMAKTFGRYADRYPTPEEWVEVAVPFILSITPADNGKALTVTGMDVFRGL